MAAVLATTGLEVRVLRLACKSRYGSHDEFYVMQKMPTKKVSDDVRGGKQPSLVVATGVSRGHQAREQRRARGRDELLRDAEDAHQKGERRQRVKWVPWSVR